MAIQTQLNYNPNNMDQFGYPDSGSQFPLFNNNGGFGNGIGIGIGIHQQPQFHQQQQQQQQYPFQQQQQYSVQQQYSPQSSLSALMERHTQETDQIIRSEEEKLRFVLGEQFKQVTNMIMRKVEGNAMAIMSQKDEEMGNALNKKMELENMVREMQMNNQTWKRIAEEKEALVYKLKNALKEAEERAAKYEAACEDACSVAVDGGVGGESIQCLTCGREGEKTRVVFLPCRHLCCCRYCEPLNYICPVCNTLKDRAIEATIP